MKRKRLVIYLSMGVLVGALLIGALFQTAPPTIPPVALVTNSGPYCDEIRTDCYEKYMVWWNAQCVEEWGNAWRGWCLSEASLQYRGCVAAHLCPLVD